jgi:2-keto-4-pentenoate hydratase
MQFKIQHVTVSSLRAIISNSEGKGILALQALIIIFARMSKISACSAFLIDLLHKQERCARLSPQHQPINKPEAYAIQALMEKQSAHPLWGWKIAATSAAGQKHIGVSGPLAGRYIAERVVQSGGTIPFGRNQMKVAEVEFAFKLGKDLPPRAAPYSQADVFAAVASLHPAIEIPDSRYDRFETVGELALIADNACADWMAIGASAPDIWRSMDLAAFMPTGRIPGKADVLGKGSNVLGDPRIAMTWLVNELSHLGITAKAGQIVTTGTCLVPMVITGGDRIEGDFGELGSVTARIGD